jgi:flagellar hook-associated protein 2
MATSGISFGNLTNSGGVTRFAGSSSEIDTDKLVEALVEAKRLPAVRLESKISRNEAKAAAFTELRGLLQNLRTAVAGLRNPPGALGTQENLFETKEVYYSADTTVSPATLLSVSAANKVPTGKVEIVVEQLATARKLSSEALTGDGALAGTANGGAAFAGSFTLGLAGGSTATIAVDGTMDLVDLKGAINAANDTTGITASIVKVSASDFRLVLTADETGKEVTLAGAGGSDVLGILGLSADGGATFSHPLATAAQARISVDGVTVTRPTNQITDVIDGMTFSLFRADPGTTVTVEVERSLGDVKERLRGFVEAYNAYRDFVGKHATVSETGELADDAVLFGDSLLRSLSQGIGSAVGSPVAGLGAGALSSLAGIGIKLDPGNHLTLDEAVLDKKLVTDLDAVRNVLEFRFTASSADLGVFARTNDLADTSFTVSIVDADGDGVPESATADGVALDVSGGLLKGRSGTAYAGLEMLWTGQGSASIDVTATQGIADRLYNFLDGAVDEFQGTLTQAADDLEQRNSSYQTEIEQIEVRTERYREQLIERFGAMETALSLAKSMLEQVRAQMSAFSQDG